MPLGKSVIRDLYTKVFEPVLNSSGYEAILVNESENGELIPQLIQSHIETSNLILADLTFERPNCYFEVGYAMGAAKKDRLILACEETYNSDHPKFKATMGKVHFDLRSYNIVWWSEKDFKKARKDLKQRIAAREYTIREYESKAVVPIAAPDRDIQKPKSKNAQINFKTLDDFVKTQKRNLKNG
jgi:hypothetical protein